MSEETTVFHQLHRAPLLIAIAAAGLALTAAACGSSKPRTPATGAAEGSHSNATTVNVTLKEFSIAPDPATVPAGEVAFAVKNAGAVAHEMVVLKTDVDPKKLPQKDGGVDEDALQSIGEVNDVASSARGAATFRLAAGKYVLVCNLPGHYTSGMVTAFMVQ